MLAVRIFPGKWITRVLTNNDGALKFWKKVIDEVANKAPVVRNEMYQDKEMVYFYYDFEGDLN